MKILSYKNLSFIIALIGVICYSTFFHYHSIGLTDDSGYYVYASKFHFMHDIKGDSLVTFAPLYPLLLSISTFLNLDIYLWAFLLNCLIWIATILISGKIINQNISNNTIKIITMLSIGFGIPIIMNIFFLWSESLFVLLILLAIHYLQLYTNSLKSKHLFYIGIISCLCFYQRYAGIFIIASIALYILFFIRLSFLKRIGITLWYSIPVGLLCGAWLIRNKLVNNRPYENYDPAIKSLFENSYDTLNIISAYFLPDEINLYVRLGLLIIFFTGIAFILLSELKKIFTQHVITITVLITKVYILLLILLNSIKHISIIDERLLSPIYIPLVISVFILIDKAIENIKYRKLIIIAMCLWTLYPVIRLSLNYNQFMHGGLGYHTKGWERDDIILYFKNRMSNEKIFSNNPIPIILLANKDAICIPEHPTANGNNKYSIFVLWNKDTRLGYVNFRLEEYLKYYNFIHRYQNPRGNIYAAIQK